MGLTGLARWYNSPPDAVNLIREHLQVNHNAVYRGRWYLTLKSYRSPLPNTPLSRSLCILTMGQVQFVVVEDPLAPTRADVQDAATHEESAHLKNHSAHYRSTFVAIRPPGALEHLLDQMKTSWTPSRPAAAPGQTGVVVSIGTDWLVRCGNVVLAGGNIKGMLVEVEYLPVPRVPGESFEAQLLSDMLTTVLPTNQRDAILADDEVAGNDMAQQQSQDDDDEDLYVYGDDQQEISRDKHGDWTGVERDKRSAYLVIGALQQERII
ncbi:hypothetical protein DL96DRAFT_1593228 [Flagelloscypha sp. PMI_526]|nr:hypothetical protein DL96DRAFT_1593228 [Flagelloscypha sp. PMI_526]